MRNSTIIASTALGVVLAALGACTGVVGLAHGDPGRDPDGTGRPAPATAPSPDASAVPPITPGPAAVPLPAAAASAADGTPGVVSAVTVTFSDHAQQLAAGDPRLTPGAIALAVENELRAHQLYAPGADNVHRTLSITIEDLTSTLASNAVVMGYTFRNVVLLGEVQVQAEARASDPAFTVHARTRVTSRAASATAASLGGVFTRFAVLTVADLRGVEAPAEPIPR